MTAITTTLAVLDWSLAPEGPPPGGDLAELDALLSPPVLVRATLAEVATVAAARLGLSPKTIPPETTAEPLAPDGIWLAAAIGAGSHPGFTTTAIELVRLCNAATGWSGNWLGLAACHALVGPALAFVPEILAAELRLVSPLTSVLSLPAKGEEDVALALAERLAGTPDGQRLIAHRFADPNAHPEEIRWRARIMEDFRLTGHHRLLALDIYEAAVALHAEGWKRRIGEATAILAAREPTPGQLETAMAIGSWWLPFLGLYRNDHEAIRERRYLNDFDLYLAGLRLAQVVRAISR
ncbi:MAG: hypothetical protein BECKG1743D_GA0114223_105353 [Candidatus Kentron sp. G]|nr:MAG: hypothetical protein BECKG1743E_GA0114224_105223 [Candidatus Kentron sp. G]VFN03984.1 MAG: hypothetical protein BECKG1743D_GA0114223_105353 [Candidatus Kentron sp. G]VFN05052.1 MAG: hypothetical protein BECKG1743F_GA0114225_110192 [Candidatus Kentron sp. G]